MKRFPALATCLLALSVSGPLAAEAPAELQPEDSDVATLSDPSPEWVFVTSQWDYIGTRFFDGGAEAEMKGMLHHSAMANFAIDPAGKYYYIAETIWSKGNRGIRQDMISVYDMHSLKLLREIPLPGRLLINFREYDLTISADGRYAYVFNFDPAASVVVVDLKAGKVAATVETPGCGLAFALPGDRVMSLCNDGTLSVTGFGPKAGEAQSSTAFFSASDDPVFDNSPVDAKTGAATFLTYSGLVREADLGSGIELGSAWSVQEAAGMMPGSTKPLMVNWYPGGRQPIAVHKSSRRAWVLMHMGEFWSPKAPAEEIWELDLASRKVVARHKLEGEGIEFLAVSQDADPQLYVGGESTLYVYDPDGMKEIAVKEGVVGGLLVTPR